MTDWRTPARVYLSYNHDDRRLKDQLLTHLNTLRRQGVIEIWDDGDIAPGASWKEQIDTHLALADVMLVLISPSYLSSQFCQEYELPRALDRMHRGELVIIPIILTECDWVTTPIGQIQALPTNGRPVSRWRKRDEAFVDVAQGVRQAIGRLATSGSLRQTARAPNAHQSPHPQAATTRPQPPSGKTLIIHGHPDQDRLQLADFLQNRLGLPAPIVMAQQMTPGLPLPTKFESLAGQVEFAIALLTPDDEGRALSEHSHHPRARQNVLIEIGWFWGRLGIGTVLLLVKDKVEIPTDLQGLEYHSFSKSPVECSEKIRDFYKAHNVVVN